jgi:hypothetical protein
MGASERAERDIDDERAAVGAKSATEPAELLEKTTIPRYMEAKSSINSNMMKFQTPTLLVVLAERSVIQYCTHAHRDLDPLDMRA